MTVKTKDDLFIGCNVFLNDGRIAVVTDEHEDDSLVYVTIEDESEELVFIGEPMATEDIPLWICDTFPDESEDDLIDFESDVPDEDLGFFEEDEYLDQFEAILDDRFNFA